MTLKSISALSVWSRLAYIFQIYISGRKCTILFLSHCNSSISKQVAYNTSKFLVIYDVILQCGEYILTSTAHEEFYWTNNMFKITIHSYVWNRFKRYRNIQLYISFFVVIYWIELGDSSARWVVLGHWKLAPIGVSFNPTEPRIQLALKGWHMQRAIR